LHKKCIDIDQTNLQEVQRENRNFLLFFVVGCDLAAFPIPGSRSFGAKNNDPLEVFVFTDLFERLSWLGWSVPDKQPRWG
jgi:hypothetical protein